jgi:PKD repeat protein
MRIPVCFLSVLVALVSCVPLMTDADGRTNLAPQQGAGVRSVSRAQQRSRPPDQSSYSVNVRPRVTKTPGVPTVKVTADRNRVPLGEWVTFTLTPASVVRNSRYGVTLFFGDGARQVMRQTETSHLYCQPGNYTFSVLVESTEPIAQKPTLTIPSVKLSATPRSVEIDAPVNFEAQLSNDYPKIKYRFVFDDGSQTDWQDSPQTTHKYRAAGPYQAYVDIGLGNRGAVKQVAGSLRETIKVTAGPPKTIAVDLSANRLAGRPGDEVEFLARTDSNDPNIRYRFDFGDRSGATAWQVSPRTKHVYASAGDYSARVDVRLSKSRSGSQTASSKPLSIKVESASLPAVDLSVVPRSIPAGLPVFFSATVDSANTKTRYRFNFGDGSAPTAWQQTPQATHIYSLSGDYPAFVEVGLASKQPVRALATSGRQRVQVLPLVPTTPVTPTPPSNKPTPPRETPTSSQSSPTPSSVPSVSPSPTALPLVTETPTPSPDGSSSPITGAVTPSPSPTVTPTPPANGGGSLSNWWMYLLAALILFAGYQGWKYFYAPRPTLVPNIDPGVSALGSEGGPLAINFQMELDPNVNDGNFTVDTKEGSFIKSERKSDG